MDGASTSSWSVRPFRADDAAALAAALADRGDEPPERPPRSLALPDPAAAGFASGRLGRVVVDRGERPAAFLAGRSERFVVDGEACAWLRLDVACSARGEAGGGGLARGRPLALAAEALLRDLGGAAADDCSVVYGFPSRRAFRLAYARSGAEVVRNQNVLRLEPGKELVHGAAAAGEVVVDELERFPEGCDGLFRAAAEALAALRVRDAAALNARFAGRPELRRLVARDPDGTVAGLAVYRPGEYDGERVGLVHDWLERPGAPAAGHALRARLAELAGAQGRPLVALLPDTCPAWRAFQHDGFLVLPSADYLVVRSFRKPWGGVWMHRSWYYTLSDFED